MAFSALHTARQEACNWCNAFDRFGPLPPVRKAAPNGGNEDVRSDQGRLPGRHPSWPMVRRQGCHDPAGRRQPDRRHDRWRLRRGSRQRSKPRRVNRRVSRRRCRVAYLPRSDPPTMGRQSYQQRCSWFRCPSWLGRGALFNCARFGCESAGTCLVYDARSKEIAILRRARGLAANLEDSVFVMTTGRGRDTGTQSRSTP